jgi:hypothetical protein
MTRVFIEPRSGCCLKVVEEPFDARKPIGLLLRTDVAVIAFPGFVVIAQHTISVVNQREPVFVSMRAAGHLARTAQTTISVNVPGRQRSRRCTRSLALILGASHIELSLSTKATVGPPDTKLVADEYWSNSPKAV